MKYTIEQKYIAQSIDTMKDRVEFLKGLQSQYEEERKGLAAGSYAIGMREGMLMMLAQEIKSLEQQIEFLRGALE